MSLEGKTVGILGLSFKPNTDDLREAPSIEIVEGLIAKGAGVRVFDPVSMDGFERQTSLDVTYCGNAYEAAQGCHAVVLVTEWNEFREMDLARIKDSMVDAVFVDCRNVYKPERVEEFGFRYQSFGRGTVAVDRK